MIEGSRSIHLTNGSASGRPKNIRIRRFRIRNTAYRYQYVRAETAGPRYRSCRACSCSGTAASPPPAFSWRPPARPSNRKSTVRTGRLFVPVRSPRVCFRQSWAIYPNAHPLPPLSRNMLRSSVVEPEPEP